MTGRRRANEWFYSCGLPEVPRLLDKDVMGTPPGATARVVPRRDRQAVGDEVVLLADGNSYVTFLNPGDTPEAVFNVSANDVTARAYCNLHGFWKS